MVDKISQSSGNLHSNDEIDLKKGQTTYTGDVTAVGKIDIAKYITVDGDVFAGGDLQLDNNVTITGDYQGYADVDPVDLPSFTFSTGGEDILVRKNNTKELLPGTYGTVEVEVNGKFKLFTGEYFIEELKIKKSATLEFQLLNGASTISVEKMVDLGEDVEIILLPSGEIDSRYVNINSLEDIVIDKNSVLFKKC